jgi:hypothetical protein
VETLCLKIKAIDEIALDFSESIRLRCGRNISLNIRTLLYAVCGFIAYLWLRKTKAPPPKSGDGARRMSDSVLLC